MHKSTQSTSLNLIDCHYQVTQKITFCKLFYSKAMKGDGMKRCTHVYDIYHYISFIVVVFLYDCFCFYGNLNFNGKSGNLALIAL